MVVARIIGVWLIVLGAFILFRALNSD